MVLSYLPLGSHAKQARRMIPYYRLSSNLVIQVSFRETIAAKEKPSSLSFSVPFLIFEIIHFCRLFLIEQYHRWNERSESFYDRRPSLIRIYLPLCHFLKEELRWWRKPHVQATHADHQLIHKSLYKSLIFNRRYNLGPPHPASFLSQMIKRLRVLLSLLLLAVAVSEGMQSFLPSIIILVVIQERTFVCIFFFFSCRDHNRTPCLPGRMGRSIVGYKWNCYRHRQHCLNRS